MNKSLIGALVVAMALLPSFASAASFPYDVEIGDMEKYTVLGSSPTLSQTTGDAFIDHTEVVAPGVLDVWVKCRDTSSVDCTGNILTS